MALDFGLAPEEMEVQVSNAIAKSCIEKNKGFIYVGVFGLGRLFGQASKYNNEQVAYNIDQER